MIYKFSIYQDQDVFNKSESRQQKKQEILLPDLTSSLQTVKDYYIEAENSLTDAQIKEVSDYLKNSLLEKVVINKKIDPKCMALITYKKGIVDNENDTIITICELLGIKAVAGKTAKTYVSSDPNLVSYLRTRVLNENIEDLYTEEPVFDSLGPRGMREPARTYNLSGLQDNELEEIGTFEGRNLSLDAMKCIQKLQQDLNLSHVTDVLLEALDARWSDHCAHTTWKALDNLLSHLIRSSRDTENRNIISSFKDNAGVWDFYDNFCLTIKGETHNGPTAISAYFGQLTKLGGVIRDILGTGLGSNPIGSFEYTATGLLHEEAPLPHRPSPLLIATETMRAIKEYGNTVGIPMMTSKMHFHTRYRGKPFALGGCIGIIPKKYAQKGNPQTGDLLLLIGGLTGNDGIHGASASSRGAVMDGAAVQIGSPLEEVKFREAILSLRDADVIRAITDLGAAGINSAAGEMGEECGVWVNTALVPLKTKALSTWRILLSESQERMILAVPHNLINQCRDILERFEVRGTVIGKFTGFKRYTVVHDEAINEQELIQCPVNELPMTGEVGFNIPYNLIKDPPLPSITVERPQSIAKPQSSLPSFTFDELTAISEKMLSDPNISCQLFADMQYDSTVQGMTYYGPYFGEKQKVRSSFYASVPLYGKEYAALFATSFNPFCFDINPLAAAENSFYNVLIKLVSAGVSIPDICLCDNFYTPHLDNTGFYWLKEMVLRLSQLSRKFEVPFISGKDSSAGSTTLTDGTHIHVPPAVYIAALGKIDSYKKLCLNGLVGTDTVIVKIGNSFNSADISALGGSALQRTLGLIITKLQSFNDEDMFRKISALHDFSHSRKILSHFPIDACGIYGSLFQLVLASGKDIEITNQELIKDPYKLFIEDVASLLIEIKENDLKHIPDVLSPKIIGRIIPEKRETSEGMLWIKDIGDKKPIINQAIKDAWHQGFRRHFV
jgi:phosphoribosylformylglycinamidine (FGAM) synthase-like enzyme